MSRPCRKNTKTDLIAIYRLEFYKNQKNWKFCNNKKNVSVGKKSESILNETYDVTCPSESSELNEAFMMPSLDDSRGRTDNDTSHPETLRRDNSGQHNILSMAEECWANNINLEQQEPQQEACIVTRSDCVAASGVYKQPIEWPIRSQTWVKSTLNKPLPIDSTPEHPTTRPPENIYSANNYAFDKNTNQNLKLCSPNTTFLEPHTNLDYMNNLINKQNIQSQSYIFPQTNHSDQLYALNKSFNKTCNNNIYYLPQTWNQNPNPGYIYPNFDSANKPSFSPGEELRRNTGDQSIQPNWDILAEHLETGYPRVNFEWEGKDTHGGVESELKRGSDLCDGFKPWGGGGDRDLEDQISKWICGTEGMHEIESDSDSIVDFYRGAHNAPHSSEIDLRVCDGELWRAPARRLLLALRALGGELALRDTLRKTRSPFPQSYSPSSDEYPTRDTDTPRPRPSEEFLAGSHNNFVGVDGAGRGRGRGRGRLPIERVNAIGRGRFPNRLN